MCTLGDAKACKSCPALFSYYLILKYIGDNINFGKTQYMYENCRFGFTPLVMSNIKNKWKSNAEMQVKIFYAGSYFPLIVIEHLL